MKNIFNTSVIDKIFIAIVAIALLIPVSHINHDEKSITENRMLAVRPELITHEHKINNKFGIEYDKWFSDRFFGRDILIKLYSAQGGSAGGLKVLVENDNWLFYTDENSLRNFANMDRLSTEQLQQATAYISNFDDWCKQHNKQFILVIAPDKNKIYGEYITKVVKVYPDTQSRANQLVDYLHANTQVNVLYLYDTLMTHKQDGLLYLKNDTHWNDYGAYIGYKAIMNALNIKPIQFTTTTNQTNPRGDLTKMATNIPADNDTMYISPNITDTAKCTKDFPSVDIATCTNKHYTTKKSVLTLRDSFSTALERYYTNTFKSVKLLWRYDINEKDLEYIKNNVDIVILEIVERNIPLLSSQEFPKD